jgi:hypothetical protein
MEVNVTHSLLIGSILVASWLGYIVFKRQNRNESLKLVAWARTNDRGDLFDLRLQNNPYVDQSTVVPLFIKMETNNERY